MTSETLTLENAVKMLRSFSCTVSQTFISESEKQQLREAISLIIQESEWENFGICADTATQALDTLNRYLQAFNYPLITENLPDQDFPNAVYLKYNSQKQSYYLDNYSGDYRGVLISCQGEDERIIGTYGHFPLDLYLF